MFVTKKNMANAVAIVSKQLENVHETLAVSSLCWHSYFPIFSYLVVADAFWLFNLCSQQKGILQRGWKVLT